MVMVRWISLGIALATWLTSMPAGAQTATPVGIVTTLQGQATVAHTASSSTLPLKFKDSIFERDRINTAENSIVKVLMGGRAVVTVRELSVLTITEDLGRTTVNLESGKIAVSVAKQKMKPGETLEVHTPNAVARCAAPSSWSRWRVRARRRAGVTSGRRPRLPP